MSDKIYKISALLIFIAVVLFPVYQLIQSGGLLFYTNGWDEASYLQFDYAKHVFEISSGGRAAQYLIILLHKAGLSGGYINLLFDLITLLIILRLLPAILSKAGIEEETAKGFSISLLGIPLIVSNINPLFELIQSANMESSSLSYITMPFINDPFWLRTPEPQLSIILLLTSLYFSLSFNNCYIVLLASLISYPFVGVPAFFVAAASLFRSKLNFNSAKSLLASFLLVATLLLNYRLFYLSDYLKEYMVITNLPLISICGLAAGIFYLFARNKNYLSLVLLTSLWFAVNFQIISGFTIQPNNFEQYWSACILVLTIMLLYKENFIVKKLPALSIALIILWTGLNFKINSFYFRKITLSEKLLADIKTDPSVVAINDIALSTRLDMLYARQKPLLFSYTRFYKKFPEIFLEDFLCARETLSANSDFTETVKNSEEIYTNGDKNYSMNTIKRVYHEPPQIDLKKKVSACQLKIYGVN